MDRPKGSRRRPAVHITLARASRLHRLVAILAEASRDREALLAQLRVGLRTFYRELELLRRCGIKVRLEAKRYTLRTTAAEAEGRLPFPDPQLSFAEMAELARGPGEAARRLADLLAQVVGQASATAPPRRPRRGGGGRAKSRPDSGGK